MTGGAQHRSSRAPLSSLVERLDFEHHVPELQVPVLKGATWQSLCPTGLHSRRHEGVPTPIHLHVVFADEDGRAFPSSLQPLYRRE